MKKRLCAVGAFLALLALATAGWFGINGTAPILSSGDALPGDLEQRQYTLEGALWDPIQQGYRLTMMGSGTGEDLVLSVADLDEAQVLLWGKPIAAWGKDDLYQRVQTVTLSGAAIQAHGGVDLVFRSGSWGSGTKEVLSRRTLTLAKLLLGGTAVAGQAAAFALGVTMFSAGLYVLLILSSLALYGRKSSEKYLLFLAFVGAVSLLATLLTSNYALIPIRCKVYLMLRPLISICPVALHGAIGLFLYSEYAPGWMRRYLTAPALLWMTLALVVFRMVNSYSIYNPTRWALVCLVVWTLTGAWAQGRFGALILLGSYAFSEAVVVFLYLINTVHLAPPGYPIVYLHLNQLSYLFVLLTAMLLIHQRFAGKFQESEQLSEELSRMNAELDRLVEKRTEQLRDEQARKNNMMTNIFHDLRSPIFVLQGNLAQLHLLTEEEPLKTAMENKLDFLKRLTEDLFLISRLEEGAVLYEENPIDLTELLEHMERDNQAQAGLAQVSLGFHVEAPLPVWADRQRIQQALQNLIDNAFNYTPQGGSIQVNSFRKDGTIVIQVRDTGAGIAPGDLPFIFDRYFKSSRADDPRSSGLGLYIANEIIKHHRGSITVESQMGKGSCFTVSLPLLPIK